MSYDQRKLETLQRLISFIDSPEIKFNELRARIEQDLVPQKKYDEAIKEYEDFLKEYSDEPLTTERVKEEIERLKKLKEEK